MQQWEDLEVARQRSPLTRDTAGHARGSIFMIDSSGRQWQRNHVDVPSGTTGSRFGEQYHFIGWMSDARTLTALGEEGWELVSVHVSEVTYVEADDESEDGEGDEYVEEVATYYLKREKTP